MPEIISCAPIVRLRQLLPEATFYGADDVAVKGCAADSRMCQPGDLFAALVGCQVDGHDYAAQAVRRGASAILAERYIPAAGVPVCVAPDSRAALGRICQALAGAPSQKLKVIGVTGTNGKTSTSWLIASVLEAGGFSPGFTSTIVNSDGRSFDTSAMTTPPAPMLAEWLGRMAANDCSHAVLEVSSHALAQSRTAGIEFEGACITNVRRDHLDFHNSIENYRQAKGRLLRQVRQNGFAIFNADDPVSQGFVSSFEGAALTIGIENSADVTAQLVECRMSEQIFLLNAGSQTVPVRTQIVGDGHMYNCLIAAAVGLVQGISLPDIARGLSRVEKIPGRMERLECGQPFGVFVDYAHTPDALACVLRSLRAMTTRRLICVFGAGGERDREKRPLMAEAVEAHADLAVVTDDNPRREEPGRIRRDIERGFLRNDAMIVKADRAKAIEWALGQAEPGDCVLIAGKGHEDYQIVGSQRHWFDDREVARQWLYQNAASIHEAMSAVRKNAA